MKSPRLRPRFSRFFTAILAGTALAAFSASASASFDLAFGVYKPTNPTAPNADKIAVRILHGDHYHNFSANSSAPGAYDAPLSFTPTSGPVSFNLASMDISAYASSVYTTNLSPAGDFHLSLLSLSGVGGDSLNVRFWHDDHTHTMSIGGEEHLSLDEFNTIDFSLSPGFAGGSYSAVFGIFDEAGNYAGKDGDGVMTSFTIHVNATPAAIPEPSSVFLGLAAVGVVGVAMRRRRRASH